MPASSGVRRHATMKGSKASVIENLDRSEQVSLTLPLHSSVAFTPTHVMNKLLRTPSKLSQVLLLLVPSPENSEVVVCSLLWHRDQLSVERI